MSYIPTGILIICAIILASLVLFNFSEVSDVDYYILHLQKTPFQEIIIGLIFDTFTIKFQAFILSGLCLCWGYLSLMYILIIFDVHDIVTICYEPDNKSIKNEIKIDTPCNAR